MTQLFGTIGIPLAVFVHGYTGFILALGKARALWNTALMPFLFLVSAMVSGIALMILISIVKKGLHDQAFLTRWTNVSMPQLGCSWTISPPLPPSGPKRKVKSGRPISGVSPRPSPRRNRPQRSPAEGSLDTRTEP